MAATNLERALYRTKHCLLRRAAGEHALSLDKITGAFGTEWHLNYVEQRILENEARELERELSERPTV
jgi:hypothetical protein